MLSVANRKTDYLVRSVSGVMSSCKHIQGLCVHAYVS